MIKIFRNSEPLNALWLLLFAFIIRIPVLFGNTKAIIGNYNEPISQFILGGMESQLESVPFNVLLTLLIVVSQALWINFIVTKYNIFPKNTFMPSLFYVIISSVIPSFLFLNSAILLNYISILLIDRLIMLYRNPRPLKLVFDLGMIIGFATLIYFPSTVWLLMIGFGLMLFRPFVWREYVGGFLGFIVPYIFVGLFYYLTDNFADFLNIWKPLVNSFPEVLSLFKLNDLLPLIPLGIALSFSFFKLRTNFWRNVVQVRKSYQLILLMLLVSGFSFYTKPSFGIVHFVILSAPLSIFTSYYFVISKRYFLIELLFFIIVGSLIYGQLI